MQNLLLCILFFTFSLAQAQYKAKIKKLLEFVKVEGDTFTMGSTMIKDASPTSKVELSTFYIQKTEVTQELWEAVMGTNPSEDKTDKNKPVANVSWLDCQDFIKKLNSITKKKYRLPTEAEWEFAARGGKMSKGYLYAGSDFLDEVACYGGITGAPQAVGQKKPNELGLYDMSGNVWEWCQDWYADYKTEPKVRKDPEGVGAGTTHVIRGGSWDDKAQNCLSAFRRSWFHVSIGDYQGFRLVLPAK